MLKLKKRVDNTLSWKHTVLNFKKYIFNVFRDLINEKVLIGYIDTFIILAENEADGFRKSERILITASVWGLQLNIKKYHFLQREINFLDYHIKNRQLHPSPLKTKTVSNFPEPKNVKDVQSSVSLTSHF